VFRAESVMQESMLATLIFRSWLKKLFALNFDFEATYSRIVRLFGRGEVVGDSEYILHVKHVGVFLLERVITVNQRGQLFAGRLEPFNFAHCANPETVELLEQLTQQPLVQSGILQRKGLFHLRAFVSVEFWNQLVEVIDGVHMFLVKHTAIIFLFTLWASGLRVYLVPH